MATRGPVAAAAASKVVDWLRSFRVLSKRFSLVFFITFNNHNISGSLFDLIGGNPSFGFAQTAAVALVGLPLCFFLFFAAIEKGKFETEEDDKKFSGKL